MSNKDEAAAVMRQADALIQRHRRAFVAGGETGAGTDDVPVLTEVVDENAPPVPQDRNDTEMALALERWIATKLPAIVKEAMEGLEEHLTEELAERLRAEFRKR